MHEHEDANCGARADARSSLPPVSLRSARREDAAAISRLCQDFGYGSNADEIGARLAALRGMDRHIVIVAVDPHAEIVGWIAAEERLILQTGGRAEVVGIVVDPQFRRAGIGRLLMQSVECWAAERCLPMILVRTNLSRSESPQFYRALEFEHVKTQNVFALGINPARTG